MLVSRNLLPGIKSIVPRCRLQDIARTFIRLGNSEIAISTIKKIESGKGNPSLSTVEKIMDILGMEVKYEIRQTV
jgi:transcriptional regulator with XRE-family HTH domain